MTKPMIDTFVGVPADEVRAYAQAKEIIDGKMDPHTLVAFAKAYRKLSSSAGFHERLNEWQHEADLSRARSGLAKAAADKRLADQKYKQSLQRLTALEAPADSV